MASPALYLRDDHAVGDRQIVEFLRRRGAATVQDMVEFAGVTATAIRQRLTRLLSQGLIVRETVTAGRGRPTHRYSLSAAGVRTSGTNNEDLVRVLWDEVRAVKDPDVRYGLLKRIVSRLADLYRDEIHGDTLEERMHSLAALMRGKDIPFEVAQADEGQLPVLKALACPYPSLAEHDRTICSMEKMLFAEILGDGLRLNDCRLDGATHCTFESRSESAATV